MPDGIPLIVLAIEAITSSPVPVSAPKCLPLTQFLLRGVRDFYDIEVGHV